MKRMFIALIICIAISVGAVPIYRVMHTSDYQDYSIDYNINYISNTDCHFDASQASVGYISLYVPANTYIEELFNNNEVDGILSADYSTLYRIPLAYLDGEYTFNCYADNTLIASYNVAINGLSEDIVFTQSTSVVDFYNNHNIYKLSDDLDNGNLVENALDYCYNEISYTYNWINDDIFVNVDETLMSKRGTCLNKSVLLASILRSKNIPTKLVFGEYANTYHAWCECKIDNEWYLLDPTEHTFIPSSTASKYTAKKIY